MSGSNVTGSVVTVLDEGIARRPPSPDDQLPLSVASPDLVGWLVSACFTCQYTQPSSDWVHDTEIDAGSDALRMAPPATFVSLGESVSTLNS